jgi:hypothetical protein
MQRWIERALLDLKHVVGVALDRLRNRMAVCRTRLQHAKDEQVERALQELEPLALCFSASVRTNIL